MPTDYEIMVVTSLEQIPGTITKPIDHFLAQQVCGAPNVDQKVDRLHLKHTEKEIGFEIGLV